MNSTTSAARASTEPVVISLAVLVAIFGLAIIGLIIYILIIKGLCPLCKKRQTNTLKANGLHDDHEDIPVIHIDHVVTVIPDEVAVQLDPPPGSPEQPPQSPETPLQPPGATAEPSGSADNLPSDEDEESQDKVGSLRHQPMKPKYSCRYNRKTLDVFSLHAETIVEKDIVPERVSRIGILQAAQDYYEHLPSDTATVGRGVIRSVVGVRDAQGRSIESMVEQDMIPDIPDIEEVRMITVGGLEKAPTAVSHVPQTPAEFRPKSFFNTLETGADAAQKPEADVSHGMFISGTVDKIGEDFTLDLYGVTLKIPAGALMKKQRISLGILWSADHQPKLAKKEAMLSPIVSCEPHGLTFNKDVSLIIPHCANNIKDDWDYNVLQSETTATDKPTWTKLKGSRQLEGVSKIKITTKHFTIFTCIAESNNPLAKTWINLLAFASPWEGKLFSLRVYCINDYTNEEAMENKKMEKLEKNKKGKEMSSAMPLAFHNDNNNLLLEIENICSGWRLSDASSTKQKIDFELVSEALAPSCKFVLKMDPSVSPDTVECNVIGYQENHNDKKAILTIAEEKLVKTDSRMDLQAIESVFPSKLRNSIVRALDTKVEGANDWEILAEELGHRVADVYFMASEYRETGRSPTLGLLNTWVNQTRTLKEFEDLMNRLDRADVCHEIQKWRGTNS